MTARSALEKRTHNQHRDGSGRVRKAEGWRKSVYVIVELLHNKAAHLEPAQTRYVGENPLGCDNLHTNRLRQVAGNERCMTATL